MVSVNELRIGNIVNITNVGECIISGLDKIDNTILPIVQNSKKEFKVIEKMISGVLLTEEWMVKFGFEIEGTEAGDDGAMELGVAPMEKGLCFLYIPKVGRYMTQESVGLWLCNDYNNEQLKIDINRIKYVHQIQNLYFALTGEELKVLIQNIEW